MFRPYQSPPDVVRFLLATQLIAPSAVVGGGLRILPVRRERFALHEVHVGGAVLCIVKTALDPSSRPYLFAEGAILQFLQSDGRTAGLGPLCRAREAEGGHVAMEYVRDDRAATRSGARAAAAKARALAALHAATWQRSLGVTTRLPPVFDAVCGGRSTNRAAVARLMELSPDRGALLAAMHGAARHWRRQALIHGDVKTEHWLAGARDGFELRLIDWEMVRFGDPAWDVAGVLHDFAADRQDLAGGQAATGRLLDRPEPAAFLDGYREMAGPSICGAGFALRVSLCTATRLVQTALERLNTGSEWGVAGLLRRAHELFLRPQQLVEMPGWP